MPMLLRRAILTVLLLAGLVPGAAHAGALDNTWSGKRPSGEDVELVVESGSVSSLNWRGKTFDSIPSKASGGGARLDFTWPKGSGILKHTAAGADLTLNETSRGVVSMHLTSK